MSQGQRRLAAIMFTDMVGYTALGQKNESLSLALVEEQRKVIRPILARHSGREVKTIGDAFLVEFPSALDAVRSAYEIQRTIREANVSLPTESKIRLRIGVHSGDVVEYHGDISGDAVNVASRIESLSEEGGVCVTRPVFESTRNKIEVTYLSIGQKTLKNVSDPIEVFRMVMPWEGESQKHGTALDSKRIAVLPFVSLSPDPNDEYFADGLTEELIDRICQIRELEVIARTSVMNYKGARKNALQIGMELKAGSLVEGSVRKAGSRIRVTAQLIDANNEGHLWSSSYDRNLDDMFTVQSEIAQRVAESASVKLLEKERINVARVQTRNVNAHESYLRGLFLMNRGFSSGQFSDSFEALKFFNKAITEDSQFAAAYAALGNLYIVLAGDAIPPQEAFEKAERFIGTAYALDDTSSSVHVAKGNLALQVHVDFSTARTEFDQAIALNPSNAEARLWYAAYLSLVGDYQGAIETARVALDLDPASTRPRSQIAYFRFLQRDYVGSVSEFEKVLQLDPNSPLTHLNLGSAYYFAGMDERAKAELDEAIRLRPEKYVWDLLAWELAVLGRKDEARKILNEAESDASTSPTNLAIAYVGLGEKEKALKMLERDFEGTPANFLFRFRISALDPLRDDPRFMSLVKRLKIPDN